MNLKYIKDLVASRAARQILLAQKYSPQILLVAGTIGVVGTVVLACRATLKTQDVLDEHEKQHANLVTDTVDAVATDLDLEVYEKNKKQANQLKVKTALDIAKLYAPVVGLGALSIAALTGSHVILTKRNGAIMAAYAGLHRAHTEYRQHVTDEYGEDVDKKFSIGAKDVNVEEKTAEGTTKITKSLEVKNDGSGSPYRFLFDECSHKWSREPGRNAMTLVMEQSHANDKLRANRHLFLNEVLDMLGLPRTKAGAVVGWVYRHDSEPKNGDNYVDFGIYRGDLERAEAFVDGAEHSVWMDMNVDGVILDLI